LYGFSIRALSRKSEIRFCVGLPARSGRMPELPQSSVGEKTCMQSALFHLQAIL
jgi:hypothetical protein